MSEQLMQLLFVAVPSLALWDMFRRWNRSASPINDRSLANERAVTALELKSKRRDIEYGEMAGRIDGLAGAYKKLSEEIAALETRFAGVEKRSEGTTQTVTNFINEVRPEIQGIKQRETMALAGLAGKQPPKFPGMPVRMGKQIGDREP